MERKWHDRLGLFLIVALFLIEIPRYQSTLPDHNPVIALGMGILLAGGAYYCVETWGMVKRSAPNTARIGWLSKMILVQIILAPVIMTPPMAAQQLEISVSEWLKDPLAAPMLLLWTFIVTLAPIMVGGMVAFARSLQYEKGELRSGQHDEKTQAAIQKLQATIRQLESSQAAVEQQHQAAIQQLEGKWQAEVRELEAAVETHEAEVEQVERSHQAEVQQLQAALTEAERSHQAEVRQLEAAIAEYEAEVTCPYCSQTFESKQARVAHERWCEKNPDGKRAQPSNNGSLERNTAK